MSNNKLTIKPTDSPREEDPLLEVKDDDGSAQEQEFQTSFRTRRLITIEPCVAFYMMAWWTSSSVLGQYVYQRESDYYNLSSYVEFNSSSGECGVDKNTTHYYYQQKAQQATAQFTLYNDSCASAIEILTVLVYGSLSDQIGRRVPLILSTAGATLKLLLWVAIMRFDLPIFLFIVAGAIESLCGGSTSFLMAVFSFIADISSRKGRAFRITVTEAIFGLSNSVAQVSIGYSIQYLGFTYPTLMLFGLFLFSSLYAIFFVEETRVISRRVSIFAIHQHIMASFRVWTVSDGKGRRSLLLTLLPLFFLSALCLIGLFISRNLFLLDSPFCWGSVFLGVYAAFGLLVTSCGQMITVSFGLRWTNEVVLIAVGTISAASSLILLAFSTSDA